VDQLTIELIRRHSCFLKCFLWSAFFITCDFYDYDYYIWSEEKEKEKRNGYGVIKHLNLFLCVAYY
jgi:hypothetical protein